MPLPFVAQHLADRTALRLRRFQQMHVLADCIDGHLQLLGNGADRLTFLTECLNCLIELALALYGRRNRRRGDYGWRGGWIRLRCQ